MSATNPLVQGLEHLRKAELHASEYYMVAWTYAEKHRHDDLAELYKTIADVHGQLALQFEGRKETLEKEGGEGLFGELFENVIEALRSFVADLPVLFFEKETTPTPTTLMELERDLADKYLRLLEVADDQTSAILKRGLDASARHIEMLKGL